MDNLIQGIKAGFSLFYISTYEPNSAIEEALKAIDPLKESQFVSTVTIWDFAENPDPQVVIDLLNGETNSIVIAKNFHWFLKDFSGDIPENGKPFVQYFLNNIESFSTVENRKTFIIVSSDSIEKALPNCLLPHFRYIEHSLPDKDEIKKLWEDFKEGEKGNPNWKPPKNDQLVIDYSKGLTKTAIINAFSLATIKGKGKIDPLDIAYLRAEEIEKTPGVKIGKFGKDFSSLQGYDILKSFVKSTISSSLSKGVMLLGPPGTGKTHFAECLGNETGLLTIVGEMAELMGEGLVGQAENSMKRFIDVIKANSPCILFIDEIERGLSGAGKNMSDGGTTARSMGQFLKFLSNEDERKGVYVIATCNDISSLAPEWTRAERWDGVFFIDLPNESEKDAILNYYHNEVYKLKAKKGTAINMVGWSGAEIKTCCRLAKMMKKGVSETSKFVIPIAKTKKTEIEALRTWASNGNCLIASAVMEKENKKVRRKINY